MPVNLLKEPLAEEPGVSRPIAMPDLKPYLRGSGHTIRAAAAGSAALARRIWSSPRLRALLGRIDWAAAVRSPACWFCSAAGALAAWRIAGPYLAPGAAVVGGGWVVLALMHSRPEPAAADDETDEELEEPAMAAQPHDSRAAFIAYLWQAIGVGPGVHLRTLATLPPLDGYPIARIRALCDRHGVLVEDRVKVAGKVTVGIRRKHLPPLSPIGAQEQHRAGSSAA